VLEEERKYQVDSRFCLPDVTDCLPAGGRLVPVPPKTLHATYYDTPDLRLARAGISLRHRRGDDEPWTVKLPTPTVGTRREVSRAGPADAVPAELGRLLTAVHRGAPLSPAATLRTRRRGYELRDADDRVLVEIADDTVTVLEARQAVATFREIEAERRAGRRKLLKRVGKALRDAGAVEGAFVAKHVRAMGAAASEPPDLVAASGPMSAKASAARVVTRALRRDIGRIFEYDPLVRLREPLPDGDTAVHQMRVGCRRLRSDLKVFRPLLDAAWADGLREELGWLADALGGARDAEVLRERLRRTATTDPLAPLDDAAVARIDADLAARQDEAVRALDGLLSSERYLDLLERLIVASRAPQLAAGAHEPARDVLPGLVDRPWRKLRAGAGVSAGDPDDTWHALRIRGKRARYAIDAVAETLGGGASGLAKALGAVQDLLGEHQDAAVAAETWLAAATAETRSAAATAESRSAASAAERDDLQLAITAGRLYERERATIRDVRQRFPTSWAAADRTNLTGWLPS
jgi:CHAD domain-containing protein